MSLNHVHGELARAGRDERWEGSKNQRDSDLRVLIDPFSDVLIISFLIYKESLTVRIGTCQRVLKPRNLPVGAPCAAPYRVA